MLKPTFPSLSRQTLAIVLKIMLQVIFWLLLVSLLAIAMLFTVGIFIPTPVIATVIF